jgi:hypothetical protein
LARAPSADGPVKAGFILSFSFCFNRFDLPLTKYGREAMHISTKFILPLVGCLALLGCAGRAPQPVAVVQQQDRFMDCAAIQTEVLANNARVQDLASESGGKVAQNVAAGVAGLFIWPLWFAMDFQGATDKDTAALTSRQQYLAVLAEQRHCGAPQSAQSSRPPSLPAHVNQ